VDAFGKLAVQIKLATREIAVQLRVQLFLHPGVQIDGRSGLVGGNSDAGRRGESEQGGNPDDAATHIPHESVSCKMLAANAAPSVETRRFPQKTGRIEALLTGP